MNDIEKYVNGIITKSNLSKSEKEEFKAQFMDHINSLIDEYISNGKPETEAINLAIENFGSEDQLSQIIHSKFNVNNIIKRVTFVVFFLYLFVLCGHYIKLDSSDSMMPRLDLPESLIPFSYIFSLTKDIYKHGLNINNMDKFITYFVSFIPVGMLLPILTNKLNSFRKTAPIYISLTFGIITIRFIFNIGAVFIDQFILHLTGCIVGYVITKLIISNKLGRKLLFDKY